MESRRSRARRLSGVGLAVAILGGAFPVGAQPTIQHDGLDCLARDRYTRLVASIEPPENVHAAKVYFRSALHADFYFVAMTAGAGGGFEAVLPLPSDETSGVVYYIEVVDSTFQTARSEEHHVSVQSASSCRPGPGSGFFPGEDPGIVVGATRAGATALPPGFQASGITGFMSAAGAIASMGGGIGTGVAIGAAAGAAAGVGLLAASGEGPSGSAAPTSSVPGTGGLTSTVPSTTSAPTSSISPSTTTTVAGTSTTSTFPSTSSVLPSSTTTSVAATTTSSAPTTTTSAAPELTACFRWEALGSCRVLFESCSSPEAEIVRYEWRMLGPPVPDPPQSPSFTFSFERDPRCRVTAEFVHPVRLTVFDRTGRSASEQQNVTVASNPPLSDGGELARLSFTSRLVAAPFDPEVRVGLSVDGAPLPPMVAGSKAGFESTVPRGVVRIEAVFTPAAPPGSLLELDFGGSAAAPESLEVESGTSVASDGRRVVFRLSGASGETIRLRVRMR